MKKFLMILTAAAVCVIPAALKAQKGTIYEKSGKETKFDSIYLQAERYGYKEGANTLFVPKKDVKFIRIDEPQVIADAKKAFDEGKYAEAAKLFTSALETTNGVPKGAPKGAAAIAFKDLGWEFYCKYYQALSYLKANELDNALKIFVDLSKQQNPANPNDAVYILNARLEIGNVYLEKGDYAKVNEVAKTLAQDPDPKAGFGGYLLRGKVLRNQAKAAKTVEEKEELTKKAALSFFGAALLFEKDDQRPEALFLAWEMLTELKDVRAEAFKKILQEKYPNNDYTKKLK